MKTIYNEFLKIICIIFILFISICITLSGKEEYLSVSNILFMGALLCGILFGIYCFVIKNEKYTISTILQGFIVCLIFSLFWNLCTLHNRVDNINWYFFIVGFFSIHLNLLFCGKELLLRRTELKIAEYFKEKKHLLFLLIPLIVLCLFETHSINVWDMGEYESMISKLKTFDYTMNTFSLFNLCEHTSWGYALLTGIGEFISPINGTGIRIIHIIMAAVTVIFFEDIIKYSFPNLSNTECLLYSALFAISPLFLGLVHYISIDYGVLCFFVWMVFAHIKKYKIFQAFSAFLLCFSKETGVILCFLYFFSYALYQAYSCNKNRLRAFFFNYAFFDICLIISPVLLFCIYSYWGRGTVWKSPGGPPTGFFFSRGHIIRKTEAILGGNFGWIYLFFIIIGIILAISNRKQNKTDKMLLWVTTCCFIGYSIFSCLYVTYNHFRYNQVYVFLYTVLFIYAIQIFKSSYRKCIVTAITSLLLIENFITADPVMYFLFKPQRVESLPMITTRDSWEFSEYNVSDSIVYNYQYQYYFHCLDRFLSKIDYDGTQLILFPDVNSSESSSSYCLLGTSRTDVLYYVPALKAICTYDNDLEYAMQYLELKGIPLNILFIDSDMESDDTIQDYKEVYYIEPHLGYENINEKWEIGEKGDIRYGTTYITYYKVIQS